MLMTFNNKFMRLSKIEMYQTLLFADNNKEIELHLKTWCKNNNIALVHARPNSFDLISIPAVAVWVNPSFIGAKSWQDFIDFQKESDLIIHPAIYKIDTQFVFSTHEYNINDLLSKIDDWLTTLEEFINTPLKNQNDLPLLYESTQADSKNDWDRTLLYLGDDKALESRLIVWCMENNKDLFKGEKYSSDYLMILGFSIIYDLDYLEEEPWTKFLKNNEVLRNDARKEYVDEFEKEQVYINVKDYSHDEIIDKLNQRWKESSNDEQN